jgi:hypothetical protein
VGAEKPSPQSEHSYCFERGATRTGAGHGWADVWKQGVFAFEYKANGKNLDTALKQLMTYALALDNPPLLVVCDTDVIQIHTHFTGTPSQVHTIALSELGNPENLNKLNALFHNPDYFRPKELFGVTDICLMNNAFTNKSYVTDISINNIPFVNNNMDNSFRGCTNLVTITGLPSSPQILELKMKGLKLSNENLVQMKFYKHYMYYN